MRLINKVTREIIRIINQFLKIINCNYRIVKNYATIIENISETEKLNDIIGKHSDYWIIMPLSAFGDSLVVFKLIKKFKEEKGGKVLILSNQERILQLAKMFDSIDKSILITNNDYSDNIFTGALTKIVIGKLFATNFYINFIFNKTSSNMLTRARAFLEINNETYGESPIFSKESCDFAKEFIENNNMKDDKIILITPFATTMNDKSLKVNFWNELAIKLEKNGYKVVFNSHKDSKISNDFIKFMPNIEIITAFSSLCHCVIGFRSGILDVIRDGSDVRMIAIYNLDHCTSMLYQDFDVDKNKSPIENYINCCTLNTMYNKNNTLELIYQGDEEAFKAELLGYFLT